jgi:hypothetical protein
VQKKPDDAADGGDVHACRTGKNLKGAVVAHRESKHVVAEDKERERERERKGESDSIIPRALSRRNVFSTRRWRIVEASYLREKGRK